jgi:hypothetical protein
MVISVELEEQIRALRLAPRRISERNTVAGWSDSTYHTSILTQTTDACISRKKEN